MIYSENLGAKRLKYELERGTSVRPCCAAPCAAGAAHAAKLKAAVTRIAPAQKFTADEVHAALLGCFALGEVGLLAPAGADEGLMTALSGEVARLETLQETDSLLKFVLAAVPGKGIKMDEGLEVELEEGEGVHLDALIHTLAQGANADAPGDVWHNGALNEEEGEEDEEDEEEEEDEEGAKALMDVGGDDLKSLWLSAIPAGERKKLEAALAAAGPGAEPVARLLAAGPNSTTRFYIKFKQFVHGPT